MNSFEQLKKQDPKEKAIKIPLAGMEFPWLPTVLAAERAKAKGYSLGSILDGLRALQGLYEDQDSDVSDMMDTFSDSMAGISKVIWYGFLTFDESVTLDLVQTHVDKDSVQNIPLKEMMGALFPSKDPQVDEGDGKKKDSDG